MRCARIVDQPSNPKTQMSIKVRKHYTAEFKAQAVELVRAGRATQTVATELEVELSCLYTWVRSANAGLTQAQGAQFGSGGLRAGGEQAAAHELRTLRRELARLQMENDILKKAAVILGTKAQSKGE